MWKHPQKNNTLCNNSLDQYFSSSGTLKMCELQLPEFPRQHVEADVFLRCWSWETLVYNHSKLFWWILSLSLQIHTRNGFLKLGAMFMDLALIFFPWVLCTIIKRWLCYLIISVMLVEYTVDQMLSFQLISKQWIWPKAIHSNSQDEAILTVSSLFLSLQNISN